MQVNYKSNLNYDAYMRACTRKHARNRDGEKINLKLYLRGKATPKVHSGGWGSPEGVQPLCALQGGVWGNFFKWRSQMLSGSFRGVNMA